jgi:hypothetical protein
MNCKPCPFCRCSSFSVGEFCEPICNNCGARGPITENENPIDAFNTRPIEDELRQQLIDSQEMLKNSIRVQRNFLAELKGIL